MQSRFLSRATQSDYLFLKYICSRISTFSPLDHASHIQWACVCVHLKTEHVYMRYIQGFMFTAFEPCTQTPTFAITCSMCHRHVQPVALNAERVNMNYFCKATNWLWRFPVKPQGSDPLLTACQASARLRRAWIIFFSAFTGCLLNKFVWECREFSPYFYAQNGELIPFDFDLLYAI